MMRTPQLLAEKPLIQILPGIDAGVRVMSEILVYGEADRWVSGFLKGVGHFIGPMMFDPLVAPAMKGPYRHLNVRKT